MGILGQIWLLFSIICVVGLLIVTVRAKFFSLKSKFIIHFVAFAATMLVNYITGGGFIAGYSQSEISQKYHTLITPAGFTFSIWGVIYALLLAGMIYLAWKKDRPDLQQLTHQLCPYVWMMLAVNIAWNIVFSLSMIGLSLLFILLYWGILFLICRKLIGKLSLLNVAFGIHLGWISVASIVNFFAFLVQLNGEDLQVSAELWYGIALVFGILLGLALVVVLKNAAVPLAMAWAYLGIYIKLNNVPVASLVIKLLALTGIVFLFALFLGTLVGLKWKNLFKKNSPMR